MSLTSALATFSYLKDVFQNVADGVSQLSSAGIKLDSQMHDSARWPVLRATG